VAIGGVATFIRWTIKKPKPSVESIQQTASPSLAQTANPSITQQVIVHSPSQYEKPKPQQAPPPAPTGTIKSSNIVFLRTRTAIVAGLSLDGVLLEKEIAKAAPFVSGGRRSSLPVGRGFKAHRPNTRGCSGDCGSGLSGFTRSGSNDLPVVGGLVAVWAILNR